MARRKEKTWQLKFSSILAAVMLLLIIGYFFQSYTEVREMKPVHAAREHISSTQIEQIAEPVDPSAQNTKVSSQPEPNIRD